MRTRLRRDIAALWQGTASAETAMRSLLFGACALWLFVLPLRGSTFALSQSYATLIYLASRAGFPFLQVGPLELFPGEGLWWCVSLVLTALSVVGYTMGPGGLGWWRAYAHSVYWGFLAAVYWIASPTSYGTYLFAGFCAVATWVAWRGGGRVRGRGQGGE